MPSQNAITGVHTRAKQRKIRPTHRRKCEEKGRDWSDVITETVIAGSRPELGEATAPEGVQPC